MILYTIPDIHLWSLAAQPSDVTMASHALCLPRWSAVKQDFVCSRPLLAEEMLYFASYLSGQPSEDKAEVEISVHCDVAIFTWLMSYVKRGMNEDHVGKATEQPQETQTLS